MTQQERKALEILYRHEKGVYKLLEQTIPPEQMELSVRRVYEQKKSVAAELEKRIKGAPT